jgi:hypothetical protein
MTKLWSNRAQATISCFGLRRSFRDGDLCRSLAHRSDDQFQKIAFGLATVALLLPIPHRLYRKLLALCEICRKKRADERTRTADLISLRVIAQVLQGVAQTCKSLISKPIAVLWLAQCCTVLRSKWYQSGINRGVVPSRSCSLAHASEVRSAPSRARQHTGNPQPILSLNTQHGPSYRRRDAEALGSVTYSCSSLPSVIPRVSATKRRWSSADYSAE